MNIELDHLVVAATTLEDGVRWCKATLGVTPAGGGRHALMGTHNRLLRLSSPDFPRAYLEIIAIDPAAPPPGRARWFDLDTQALQARLRSGGPQLIHWVARTPALETHRNGLADLGWDLGEVIAAQRDSPQGRLQWRILVRADGTLLCGGVLPTLIVWDGMHPADHLPDQGVALASLDLGGLPETAARLLAPRSVRWRADVAPSLQALLHTPEGDRRIAA